MAVDRKGRPGQTPEQGFSKFGAEQRVMANKTPAHPGKKGLGAAASFIQHIAGDHQIAGGQFLPQGPRGHPGQDLGHSQVLQGIEVGPGVDKGGGDLVARFAVAGKDGKLQALMPEEMHRAAVAIRGGEDRSAPA